MCNLEDQADEERQYESPLGDVKRVTLGSRLTARQTVKQHCYPLSALDSKLCTGYG